MTMVESESSPADVPQKDVEDVSCEPEIELSQSIHLMEAALAQSGNPDFKSFWGARKRCFELFKENIPPPVKALQWSRYRELTKEAKRLKSILEEQSAFAVEQIDMAIEALEQDIQKFDEILDTLDYPSFPNKFKTDYSDKQRMLNLLNTQAARVNALRKELMRTDMRIRQKNQFFQRLSQAGDAVFPKRKELIKEISQLFTKDISDFANSEFPNRLKDHTLQELREEIKSLQKVAKELTLNTKAFTETRVLLGKCWDDLKAQEKEKKRAASLLKQTYRKEKEEIQKRIQDFAEELKREACSLSESHKKFEELSQAIRSKEWEKGDLKLLKAKLHQAFKPVKDRMVAEEKKRREFALEKEHSRQNKIKEIEEKANVLQKSMDNADLATISEKFDAIMGEFEALELNDSEQESLLRALAPTQDALNEQRELNILNLSDDDSKKRSELERALKNAQDERDQTKEQINKYRKTCKYASGLDIEQSMYFNDQLNFEKKRLEKIEARIAKLVTHCKR